MSLIAHSADGKRSGPSICSAIGISLPSLTIGNPNLKDVSPAGTKQTELSFDLSHCLNHADEIVTVVKPSASNGKGKEKGRASDDKGGTL